MPTNRPLQFSLAELILWFTLLTIALSVRMWLGHGSVLAWLVLYALYCRFLRAYARRISPAASRQATFRKRFWRVALLALPFALCTNAIAFCDTFRAYVGDAYECLGWPIPFLERGGFAYEVRSNPTALAIDLISSLTIAAATALALRDGGRRVTATIVRFLSGRVKTRPIQRVSAVDHRLSHPKDEGQGKQPDEGKRDQEANWERKRGHR